MRFGLNFMNFSLQNCIKFHFKFINKFPFNTSMNKFVGLLVFVGLIGVEGLGQTTVTIGGGATITCPAAPTATYTTPPTGVSFSNWSRGSGNRCSAVSIGMSVKGFDLNKKFKKD